MRYIGIIILLVLCLTLLLLISCIVNTEEPVRWSGLGMGLEEIDDISKFDGHVDELLANGFTEIRVHGSDWNHPTSIAEAKIAVLSATAKGMNVLWGVVSSASTTLTSSNWSDYSEAVQATATWAQANGVYEFLIGNEAEAHNDDDTLTDAQLIANLKTLATAVQAIFTNGNVSYSCFAPNIPDWITAGKGDIDILASNIYRGGEGSFSDTWKTLISNLVNAFGADGTYLTEFNLSWSSLDDYSTDEAVQATALTEMIEYIKASGMTRAFYFCYTDPLWLSGFGAKKGDGTYRLFWIWIVALEHLENT